MTHARKEQLAAPESACASADSCFDSRTSLAGRVLQALSEGVVVQAADGRIVYSNSSACGILGLSADQLHGRTSMDSRWRVVRSDGSPFDGTEHPAMVAARSGKVEQALMGVYTPGGELRWLDITAVPVQRGDHGEVELVCAVFRNVTAELAAIEESSVALASFEHLMGETSDALVLTDAEGRVDYLAPNAAGRLGFEHDSLVGRSVADLVAAESRADVVELLGEVVPRPGSELTVQCWVTVPEGRRRFELRAHNLLAEPGIEAVSVTFSDVHDRWEAEQEQLRLNEALEARVAELGLAQAVERVLNRSSELLRRCRTTDEAQAVLWDCVLDLLDDGDIGLYVESEGGNLLLQRSRGELAILVRPEQCWAHRTGRVHENAMWGGLRCSHEISGEGVCIPLDLGELGSLVIVLQGSSSSPSELARIGERIVDRFSTVFDSGVRPA